ncbi:MAG: DUF188 domain-containing protein [Spirochaetales bacterium]
MTSCSVWVDADSCPVAAKELIIRFAKRLTLQTHFVANRNIPLPSLPIFLMHITDNTENAADDFIVENSNENDIVITRDIPLAARLIEKNITVLSDRGKLYTPENIRENLSFRNFNLKLIENGISEQKVGAYSKKDSNDFANCFDKELQKKLKS